MRLSNLPTTPHIAMLTGQVNSHGFVSGAIQGAVVGAISNQVQAGMNYAFLDQPYTFNWNDFWMQTAASAVVGGVLGGINAADKHANFWTGQKRAVQTSPMQPKTLGYDKEKTVPIRSESVQSDIDYEPFYVDRNDPRYQQLLKEARQKYPNKVGKIEKHHIDPKYMGGKIKGQLIELEAPYHQMITNKFRREHGYGLGVLKTPDRRVIMEKVYKNYPLPK